MPGWNPWRALRGRPDIRLRWASMHPARGHVVDHGNGLKTVTLHSGLDQRQRNASLAHELVHLELGMLWPPGTPPAIVAKGEYVVDRITTDRLVPPAELAAFVERYRGSGCVTSIDVAEEFIVPPEMADRALRRFLQDRRAS